MNDRLNNIQANTCQETDGKKLEFFSSLLTLSLLSFANTKSRVQNISRINPGAQPGGGREASPALYKDEKFVPEFSFMDYEIFTNEQ